MKTSRKPLASSFIIAPLLAGMHLTRASSLGPPGGIQNQPTAFLDAAQPQIIAAGVVITLLIGLSVVLIMLNRNLRSARRALQQLNASLESQMQERTAALTAEITERKQFELALRESEARFRSYFELPLIGIAINSPEKGWLQANDALCSMLGYTRSELMEHSLADLTHPADLVTEETFLKRMMSGEIDSYVLEKRFISKDGGIIWANVSVGCVRKPDGTIDYSVALVPNVTRRKTAETALQESEKKYRFLTENMKDVIWVMDVETLRFSYISPSVQQLRGYTPQEIMAEPMDAALTAQGARYVREQMNERAAAFAAGETAGAKPTYYLAELEQPCKDGTTVWTEVISYYWRDENSGRIQVHGVTRDISQRKAAEMALREAHEQLEQRVAERTAELNVANLALEKSGRLKDEFFAAMSHELRTPLTGVLGLTQILRTQSYGPLNEKQKFALLNIESSGQRLLQLVNNILEYTQLETGILTPKLASLSLEEVCRDCLKTCQGQIDAKHLKFSLSLKPQNIVLNADAARLTRALNHLLDNAIKFTANGGSIGIDVRGDAPAGQVQITVWDTGIGIQSEDFPRLFQPFRQLDGRLARQYSGTGLGLALVKRLVELQGGSVQVESVPGQGSRFSLLLPWHPQED